MISCEKGGMISEAIDSQIGCKAWDKSVKLLGSSESIFGSWVALRSAKSVRDDQSLHEKVLSTA